MRGYGKGAPAPVPTEGYCSTSRLLAIQWLGTCCSSNCLLSVSASLKAACSSCQPARCRWMRVLMASSSAVETPLVGPHPFPGFHYHCSTACATPGSGRMLEAAKKSAAAISTLYHPKQTQTKKTKAAHFSVASKLDLAKQSSALFSKTKLFSSSVCHCCCSSPSLSLFPLCSF